MKTYQRTSPSTLPLAPEIAGRGLRTVREIFGPLRNNRAKARVSTFRNRERRNIVSAQVSVVVRPVSCSR